MPNEKNQLVYVARNSRAFGYGCTPVAAVLEMMRHYKSTTYRLVRLPDDATNVRVDAFGDLLWESQSAGGAQQVPHVLLSDITDVIANLVEIAKGHADSLAVLAADSNEEEWRNETAAIGQIFANLRAASDILDRLPE